MRKSRMKLLMLLLASMLLSGCALLARLPGALADNAQLWSKEIENSAQNLDTLLDGAYSEPALTDANLLGLLG